jgi:tetratricopeptide (TPR) repeat protein
MPLFLKARQGREVGTPEEYVHQALLRSLLFHRRFDELTKHLEDFQTAFESNATLESWPDDAATALGTGEPELEPLLDAWVKVAPDSFAPLLARGEYWVRSGWARRGTELSAATPREDFAAMEAAFVRARRDLGRAIELRPRLVAALRRLIEVAMASSQPEALDRAFQDAIRACPTCLTPRAQVMRSLEPRWGGSLEIMEAFAASQAIAGAPRLAFLRGYADEERVTQFELKNDLEGAFRAADQAVAAGEHFRFYWRRGRLRLFRGTEAALQDLRRAQELNSGAPGIMVSMARAYQLARQWQASALWLRTALQISPLDAKARNWFADILRGLRGEALRQAKLGEAQKALKLIDLALDLAPADLEATAIQATLLRGPGEAGDSTVAALERRRTTAPSDGDNLRRLTQALTDRGEHQKVVALWTAALRNENLVGRASLERGAALVRLGRGEGALVDARRACEEGLSQGCALAATLEAPGRLH